MSLYKRRKFVSDEVFQEKMIYEAWKSLVEDFAKLKKPWGTRENPAKTCRDLAMAYPELESGKRFFKLVSTRNDSF